MLQSGGKSVGPEGSPCAGRVREGLHRAAQQGVKCHIPLPLFISHARHTCARNRRHHMHATHEGNPSLAPSTHPLQTTHRWALLCCRQCACAHTCKLLSQKPCQVWLSSPVGVGVAGETAQLTTAISTREALCRMGRTFPPSSYLQHASIPFKVTGRLRITKHVAKKVSCSREGHRRPSALILHGAHLPQCKV